MAAMRRDIRGGGEGSGDGRDGLDPVAWVQTHPDLLLGKGFSASPELLLDRQSDAVRILEPEAQTWCEVRDGWGFLRCTVDWLSPSPARDPFLEVVAFVEAGPNSARPEILVTAFSSVAATMTASDPEIRLLAGRMTDLGPAVVEQARALLRPTGRLVLLRI